jgi:hypothetical protein
LISVHGQAYTEQVSFIVTIWISLQAVQNQSSLIFRRTVSSRPCGPAWFRPDATFGRGALGAFFDKRGELIEG